MHLVHVPSTSTEGNTPKGVPHRVQRNVGAAETPPNGLMPQSHLAPFTSFHGAAHRVCFHAYGAWSMRAPSHAAPPSVTRTGAQCGVVVGEAHYYTSAHRVCSWGRSRLRYFLPVRQLGAGTA